MVSVNPERYSLVAIFLHWLIAALIVALIGIGIYMVNGNPGLGTKFWLYQLHKSLGISVFALTVLRLLWRFTHRAPALPSHMALWEKSLARFSHVGFYFLLLVIPLSGWARVSGATFNIETLIFGVVPLPHIPFLEALSLEEKKQFEPAVQATHYYLALSLVALLALHIAGALKHQFAGHSVMGRMLPFARRSAGSVALVATLSFVQLGATSFSAMAASWKIDPAKSSVTFNISVAGQKVEGRVQSFSGTVQFEPKAPEEALASVTFELATITVGNADGDAALKEKEWFDVSAHPNGTYEAKGAELLPEDGGYQFQGELTLRGKSMPVTLPFTLAIDGDKAEATAQTTIKRKDFGIGNDANTGPITVGDDVVISIKIVAVKEGT